MNGGDDLDASQLRGQGATSATRDGVIEMTHDNALPIAARAKLSEGDIS